MRSNSMKLIAAAISIWLPVLGCNSGREKPTLDAVPLSSLTFEGLRNSMMSMTDAQFKEYARSLEGKNIRWTGYVEDVHETFLGEYELWVDMDPPSILLSVQDVTFKIDKSQALRLNKDDFITFTGIIASVQAVLGSCQVSLEPVWLH